MTETNPSAVGNRTLLRQRCNPVSRRIGAVALAAAMLLMAFGCQKREAERFGKVFYLDGAGNWGYGSSDVPEGLRQAGYRGDVEIFIWTMSFNPLVDQLNIGGAKLRAAALTRKIESYARDNPGKDINVIALSAGTGVATWAIEGLSKGAKINNLVLLGSSLSHNYDMRQALSNMRGNIYVYYSPYDTVLETVKVVGTIDGKRGVDSIGAVGLRPPRGMENRVVNVGWSRKWMGLGWTGAHTDCTNAVFVRQEVSKHIVSQRSAVAGDRRSGEPVTAGGY